LSLSSPNLPSPSGQAPNPTRFILIGTSHAGNVGACARAMKVMGFHDLVLVAPRFADVLQREEAIAFASGATDVLATARVVDTLAHALEGVTLLCATAMTPRDFGRPARAPREALPSLRQRLASGHRVAFVFGSERFGMANDDVWRCHEVLTIPTAPDYGSLNLAQAVQVIAYEWRQALGGFAVEPVAATAADRWADAAAVQGALAHWREALVAVGYLDPAAPKKLLPRLNQLANRLELTPEEVHILRGIARAMVKTSQAARSYTAGPSSDCEPHV
jgi:tRNA/rRNA methyltransferase